MGQKGDNCTRLGMVGGAGGRTGHLESPGSLQVAHSVLLPTWGICLANPISPVGLERGVRYQRVQRKN